MKKSFILASVILCTIPLFAQLSLTFDQHALHPGDTTRFISISYVSPGEAGPGRIWDFSGLETQGETLVSNLSMEFDGGLKKIGPYDIVLAEKGNSYYFALNRDALMETGSITQDYTLVFQDPVLKMIYPFSFGNQFTDQFSGTAETGTGQHSGFSGSYSVTADAYGTLILPGRSFHDALRIRTETVSLEINPCSAIETHAIRYMWYVSGERYPVLSLTRSEYTIGGTRTESKQTALLRVLPVVNKETEAIAGQSVQQPDRDVVPVVVYPNPFSDRLNFHYFLRQPMPVSVSLQDITGKSTIEIIPRQVQAEGLHGGAVDATLYGLNPGVYTIRMIFDNQVVVRKVIKL